MSDSSDPSDDVRQAREHPSRDSAESFESMNAPGVTQRLDGHQNSPRSPSDSRPSLISGSVSSTDPSPSLEVGGSPQRLRLQSSSKSKKADRSVIRARLVVTDPADAHAVVYLDSTSFILGRGREADLVLMDDGASREHARFDRDETGFSITDLDSGNGTFVNGRRTQSVRLHDGDSVAIGRTRMRFETVGWRRIADDSSGFMGSMLKEHDSAASDSRLRAALIALVVGFMVCFLISLSLRSTELSSEDRADLIVQRTQTAMADGDWENAWSEVTSLEVLQLEHEHRDALVEEVNLGLESHRIWEQIQRAVEDGKPFREIEKIASKSRSNHPHFSQLKDIMDAQRTAYSMELFRRSRQHFWAGDSVRARSLYAQAKDIDPSAKVPYQLDDLLREE